jgi:hypothetical protein
MTHEVANQLAVRWLLTSLLSVLTLGTIIAVAVIRTLALRRQRGMKTDETHDDPAANLRLSSPLTETSARWLMIRSSSPLSVQSVLGLNHPKSCSWVEGLQRLSEHALLISPSVKGWLIVLGPGLPDPVEDADTCFHFIRRLSRELGQVHYYGFNRAVNQHAWIRAESAQIIRAYVWAGETLWNQGAMTRAERELDLKCFDYWEHPEHDPMARHSHDANAEKVLALAARWSVDPLVMEDTRFGHARAIAGDLILPKAH